MTTEREREARELLARECEREGAIWTASVLRNGEEPSKADRIAIRAIVAALTREQLEGVCLPDSIIGELHEVLTNVDTQFRATGQPSARIERAINLLAGLRNKRQQEAQGAVACKNPCLPWDFFNARACQKCVHEKFSPAAWRDLAPHAAAPAPKPTITLNATTPPAPVDVQTRELALEGLDYFDKAGDEGDKKYVAAIRSLLSGQQAGVDDPRITLFYEAVELQRTYYGDGAGLHLEMIDWAAKAAALGGGGGRG